MKTYRIHTRNRSKHPNDRQHWRTIILVESKHYTLKNFKKLVRDRLPNIELKYYPIQKEMVPILKTIINLLDEIKWRMKP